MKFYFVLLVLLFCCYAFLPLTTPSYFNSPDETATYVFAKNFALNGTLAIDEPLSELANKQIQPRSVNINQAGQLVPQGFIGQPWLYGLIGRVFGVWIIEFITPLLAVLGVLAFYGLVKFYFQKATAFCTTLLLAIHPVYFFYSARTMMNTVPMVSLFLIGLYFFHRFRGVLSYGLAGLFVALSLAVRMSELIWVAAILLIVLIANYKKIKWKRLVFGVVIMVLVFVPVLQQNKDLYGGYLSTGYAKLDQDYAEGIEYLDVAQASSAFDKENQALIVKPTKSVGYALKMLFVPFGFHEKLIAQNFYKYVLYIFWWLSVPMLLGAAWLMRRLWNKNADKNKLTYLLFWAVSSALLLVYYGSWWLYLYHDRVDLYKPTIDISYVRYFLPIYIFGLPLVVIGLRKIARVFQSVGWRVLFYGFYGALIICLSVFLTIGGTEISLSQVRKSINSYAHRAEKVQQLILPENAVFIIPNWADKVLSQEYKVMFIYNTEKFNQAVKGLHESGWDLYYYSERPADEIIKLSEKTFVPLGFTLKSFAHVYDKDKIFKLEELE